uniref:G_PROTEIN_RECEP_F1_2 domain-containing protein n=1 Tax=Gongylonema pulchrum TaxID=637853 RepID=A0A183DCQ7_9BILA
LIEELHEAKDIRKYVLAAVPLILATLAILLNVAFGIVVTVMWRKKQLSSLHRYSFLLSRTLSSVLALVLFYVVLIAWKMEIFRYASAAAFILVGSLTFFTVAGTYVGMITLLYTAIVHPLRYRYSITVSKCLAAIAVIWLISVALSVKV